MATLKNGHPRILEVATIEMFRSSHVHNYNFEMQYESRGRALGFDIDISMFIVWYTRKDCSA